MGPEPGEGRLAAAIAAGPVLLDGGLATQLEAQGADLRTRLWSAQLLVDDPEAIVAAHRAFFAAGAQVATTASYQAPLELIPRSVRLADRARGIFLSSPPPAASQPPGLAGSASRHAHPRAALGGVEEVFLAGSVGPYGASLADGSEYRGDYGLTVEQLRAWHRPRIAALVEAGVDVLALETIPTVVEVEALLLEVAGVGIPAWLSITAAGERTRAGEPAYAAFALAREVPEVIAVGVNCVDPADVPGLLRLAAASGNPGVAYPNRGEAWDADRKRWTGAGGFDPTAAKDWLASGARLVGGCCRVTPADIAALSVAVG